MHRPIINLSLPGCYAQRFDGVDPSGGDRPSDISHIFEDRTRTIRLRVEQEAKDVAGYKVRVDLLAAFVQESKKNAEAQQRREQELSAPPPPLEANALGQALLKNLWFQ